MAGDPLTRPDSLLAGLNEAQHRAVVTDAAPLCILAGAGSGKTRVLTRRIARRVVEGDTDPHRILAVTFTRKAAAELRDRLGQLGLRDGVTAGTFHAIASAQLRQRWAERNITPPTLLDRKFAFVARMMTTRSATAPLDVIGEIEWAKARMVPADRYVEAAAAAGRRPPVEPGDVARIYARYEDEKLKRRMIDFDDLLRLATRDLAADPDYAAARRWRFRHLFVDEFQDVNPLQFELLKAWIGDRRDLCVVGDPNQAIYAWNGADADYLQNFDRHFPGGETVVLSENYRSSPQILGVANTVLATGRSAAFELSANRPDGPLPTVRGLPDETAEARAVARRVRDGHPPGEPWSSQAVLVRTNAQLTIFEEAFRAAGIPFRSRGAGRLLDQPEVKEALATVRSGRGPLVGRLADLDQAARDAEATDERAANVAELVRLGHEYLALDPDGTYDGFSAWLASTLRSDDGGRGGDAVDLATFHSAKGLEWPVVHLAGIEEGFVPIHFAKTEAALDEERRLLYVALTRAERALHITYAERRTFGARSLSRRPSVYLETIRLALELLGDGTRRPVDLTAAVAAERAKLRHTAGERPRTRTAKGAPAGDLSPADAALLDALKAWRLTQSKGANVPAYVIFNDATLTEVARTRPTTMAALLSVSGVGPVKAQRFGPELLEIVAGAVSPA